MKCIDNGYFNYKDKLMELIINEVERHVQMDSRGRRIAFHVINKFINVNNAELGRRIFGIDRAFVYKYKNLSIIDTMVADDIYCNIKEYIQNIIDDFNNYLTDKSLYMSNIISNFAEIKDNDFVFQSDDDKNNKI